MDDVSLKAKEYLGSKVLEGEEGNSFYGSRILRIYGFADSFVDPQRSNDNGNGGEVL